MGELLGWLYHHDYQREESTISNRIRLRHYTNSGQEWDVNTTKWHGDGQLGSGLYCYYQWIRPSLSVPLLMIEVDATQWSQLSVHVISRRCSWEYTKTLLLFSADRLRLTRAVRHWLESDFAQWDVIEAPMLAAPSLVRQVVLKDTPNMIRIWNTSKKFWFNSRSGGEKTPADF